MFFDFAMILVLFYVAPEYFLMLLLVIFKIRLLKFSCFIFHWFLKNNAGIFDIYYSYLLLDLKIFG